MELFIVDTNLLFSAMLNTDSDISQFVLLSSEYGVKLYAPEYLRIEIERHKEKIKRISGFSDDDFELVASRIYKQVTFIDDELIPFQYYVEAMRLVRDIDPDDVTFVALTNLMGKILWTGDTKLYDGLKSRGYNNVVMFPELRIQFDL